MDKKQNPLTAIIFMIGILCAFTIGIPIVTLSRENAIPGWYLAVLLLLLAMTLVYVALRATLKRIDTLEKK